MYEMVLKIKTKNKSQDLKMICEGKCSFTPTANSLFYKRSVNPTRLSFSCHDACLTYIFRV